MIRTLKNIRYLVVLIGIVVCTSGCVAIMLGAAAGAGGYAWVKGVLEQNFDASAEDLYQATLKAVDALDLSVSEDRHDHLSAHITARFASGKMTKIEIAAITERTSKIRIRVGFLGDRTKSEMILAAVKRKL